LPKVKKQKQGRICLAFDFRHFSSLLAFWALVE
jgi:hypothetical protein